MGVIPAGPGRLDRALALLVRGCARRCRLVLGLALLAALAAGGLAATRLGMTTSIDGLFDASLPWKQSETALKIAYPQFNDLIVAVIDAPIPEEADATAEALAAALAPDHAHFTQIRRPDAADFFRREGLLFLDLAPLQQVLDTTVDAAPFLGQLAADPSPRGLFGALSLLGIGVAHGQGDLTAFLPALRGFADTLDAALAGHPAPLSWQRLLGGKLADLAGRDRIVLLQARLDYGAIEPGGAPTRAVRQAAAGLEFVRAGRAHVRLTGAVPLEDEEFSSAATGAALGLVASFALVMLWLFLALRSWRLMVPVVFSLLLGLVLTTGFAALAVGTLNLISVAFAILFVGIAVDFSIQFAVRFRDLRRRTACRFEALAVTAARVARQVSVAGCATAAGFLAFVPTYFRGVAELGLIAGIGMLIALFCTLTFLPAGLAGCAPPSETAEVGFAALAPLDRWLARRRRAVLAAFLLLALAGAAAATQLGFDSNTMHTKSQTSEAMRTLMHLLDNPVTNPFTADIVRPDAASAAGLAAPLGRLDLADHVVSVESFVPEAQPPKLAAIQDAASILAPVLSVAPRAGGGDAAALRVALSRALANLRPALAKLPADHPLARITEDLARLQAAPDATLQAGARALVRFLPPMLDSLRVRLTAAPVTIADVPADLRRDYVQPDGKARIQVVPTPAVANSAVLRRFVAEVRGVAPDAGGPAVTIVATADTIIAAFRQAAASAVLAIGVILLVALRRVQDAVLVLLPLLVSAALTVLVVAAAGLTLNFANIIALPLLLGVGVSFNIYFVMNAREGDLPLLTSATTRAVIFSALTTGSAFGSLALSVHPGTASMGTLLLISLGCTLLTSLIFVPALLGGRKEGKGLLF